VTRTVCGTLLTPRLRCLPPPVPFPFPTPSSLHLARVPHNWLWTPPRNSMKKLRVHSTASSWSSTAKTDSRNKAVSTLTPSNHSSTTPPPQCQGSTRTLLRSSQKSINQRAPATSPESTTRKLPFRSRVPRLQEVLRPPRTLLTCSPRTTTSSESNRVWVASRSPTKRLLSV